MAMEGKNSPFTFKNIALTGIGIFFTSWAIPKTLDYFLDTTFLTTLKDWLLGGWSWLLQDEPLPHWFLLSAIVVFTLLIGTISRLRAKVDATELSEELVKSVTAVFDRPKVQKPTKVQHKILMQMGVHTDYRITFDPDLLARDCKLTALEFEVAFGQLISMGMIKWAPKRPGQKQLPLLSQEGKEYILQARSDVQELL